MHSWYQGHCIFYSWLKLIIVVLLDLRHICQNMEQFGHGKGTIYGGCSEYTIVPAKYAYLLKSDIDDAKAAILERKLVPWQCSHTANEYILFQHLVWPIRLWRRSTPAVTTYSSKVILKITYLHHLEQAITTLFFFVCVSHRMWPNRIIWYWHCKGNGSNKNVSPGDHSS